MRKKNYKGRCEKRQVSKCEDISRTYDDIQRAYLERLEANKNIKSIRCNVPLKGPALEEYTTDFVCIRADGEMMVRECVFRRFLTKPLTLKLLDMSRGYWTKLGVKDWGIVIDEELPMVTGLTYDLLFTIKSSLLVLTWGPL